MSYEKFDRLCIGKIPHLFFSFFFCIFNWLSCGDLETYVVSHRRITYLTLAARIIFDLFLHLLLSRVPVSEKPFYTVPPEPYE